MINGRKLYIAVSVLLALLFVPIIVSAEDHSDGIDAILIIDTSGSMRTTDPDRITLEAASLFMDMMETRNSRLGIVGFSGNLHTIMPLTPIAEPFVRHNVRNTISDFVYHGWTDIGMALRTAADMLLDSPSNNSPLIILFTDGRIELPETATRTVDESYADAWWAVDNVGDFAPIYTIGLNYDGTVNQEFLQDIARRTEAQSFIVDQADALPQIFNEIFASHIRSSIIEIATIVADGETYTEIEIPIPSLFVAEANIIMLSSQRIPSVRLFDPSGQEVPLGDEPYALTYASRYTMIKVLSPMVGDWLLQVRGLPEDRITINLIYNYNVSVSLSITQPGAEPGAFYFDPALPIVAQAGFVSSLPSSHFQSLFDESEVYMAVYDMDHNRVTQFPMTNVGTAFNLEFTLDPPQNIRVNASVDHRHFEQSTPFFPITFDPLVLAEVYTPAPAPTPEPFEEIEPEPHYVEPVELEDIEPAGFLIFVLIGIALALAIAAILLRGASLRRIKQRLYTGRLELRAMLSDGNYTAFEAPDISTFAGEMSLMEFLSNSLGSTKVSKLVHAGLPVWEIRLSPGMQGSRPVINVTRKGSGCLISDGDGNAIFNKKIVWEDGQQLVLSMPGESPKLEITYRAFDD